MHQRLTLQRASFDTPFRQPPDDIKGKWKWLSISLAVHGILLTLLFSGAGRSDISSKSLSGNAVSGLEMRVSIFKASDDAHLPPSKPRTDPNESRPRIQTPTPLPRPKPNPDGGASAQTTPATAAETNTEAAKPLKLSGDAIDMASNFQQQLLAYIESYRRYPENARSNHIEGSVQISFTMDRNGRVLNIRIVHSSGNTELDDEAIKTVLRAQPLLPIPTDLPAPLNIVLPVDFKLQDSQVSFAPEGG